MFTEYAVTMQLKNVKFLEGNWLTFSDWPSLNNDFASPTTIVAIVGLDFSSQPSLLLPTKLLLVEQPPFIFIESTSVKLTLLANSSRGTTNRRNPHADAGGRYGLIGGCGCGIQL
uniref:Uncharacterized protein n=1 Tax=Romanomermis culicivorax TaxID=13658 RepID=A0A915KEQ9_ROMCU